MSRYRRPSRLTEPSTWAGISATLGTLATQIPQYSPILYALSGAAGIIAIMMREQINK